MPHPNTRIIEIKPISCLSCGAPAIRVVPLNGLDPRRDAACCAPCPQDRSIKSIPSEARNPASIPAPCSKLKLHCHPKERLSAIARSAKADATKACPEERGDLNPSVLLRRKNPRGCPTLCAFCKGWVFSSLLRLYLPLSPRHTFPMQKQCPQCGASFTCDPQGHCWCAELPHLPLPPDWQATSCLCRACLLEKIKAAEATRSRGSQLLDSPQS